MLAWLYSQVLQFIFKNIHVGTYRFQDFYEEGEREMLLAEVSELRNQVSYPANSPYLFSASQISSCL